VRLEWGRIVILGMDDGESAFLFLWYPLFVGAEDEGREK